MDNTVSNTAEKLDIKRNVDIGFIKSWEYDLNEMDIVSKELKGSVKMIIIIMYKVSYSQLVFE